MKSNAFVRYFQETRDELTRVAWPTRDQVLLHTGLVIGICVVLAAYFGVLDVAFSRGLETLLSWSH